VNQEEHPALIAYPQNAAFGRVLPKNKIYEFSGANTRLKGLFVAQVDQIVWQYKLAPETINLEARESVPELQIFSIHLKTPEVSKDVLRCIDGAVKFPIIFEMHYGDTEKGRVRVMAAYKRPNVADPSRWVLSDYFSTEWLKASGHRASMPLALDLAGLYEQLLHRLIPTPCRAQEALPELVARVESAIAKRREIEKMTAMLTKEKQFNRKIEINSKLRQLKIDLEQLSQ
jgi:Domain of unknown function (DUF4391)